MVCREIESDLTQRLAGEFGKFLVRDSLQKGLGYVGRTDIPPILDGFGDDQLLRTSRACARVPINVGLLLIFKAPDS